MLPTSAADENKVEGAAVVLDVNCAYACGWRAHAHTAVKKTLSLLQLGGIEGGNNTSRVDVGTTNEAGSPQKKRASRSSVRSANIVTRNRLPRKTPAFSL